MNTLLGFMNIGMQEMIIIAVIGVLLFGRRLPEVGRYLGKGIVEFKKGIKGLEDEVDTGASLRQDPMPMEQPRPPQRVATNAPKFEDNGGFTANPPKA